MPVSKVEVIVLGLLAEEPLYGYELLERLRDRGINGWLPVGKASVYQALRRLEERRFVTGRSEEGTEGPDRRVYRISASGRARLRVGLVERFGHAGPVDVPAHLSLGFLHQLPQAEARLGLELREAALASWRKTIAAEHARVSESLDANREVALRLLDGQDALARAELALLRSFRPR
jgi:PadR family transcriptional regulator PadR